MPQGPGGFMPPPPSAYETYQPGLGIGGPTKAEPGMRLLARIIDSILVGVIGFVIGLIFGVGAAFTASDNAGVSIGSSIIAGLIGTLIAIAYEVFLVGTRGQTLGKMAVGIKVIRTDGQPMDLMTAATRHSPSIALRVLGIIPIVGIITGLGLIVLAIVNCVMVFSNGESVYDKIGKTMVVSAK